MSKLYESSMVSKYGDIENVKADAKTVNEILDRQGSSFLLDLVAEHSGRCAIKFSMSQHERETLVKSLVDELKESLLERL